MKRSCFLFYLLSLSLAAQSESQNPPSANTDSPAISAELVSEKVDHRIIIEAPAPKVDIPLFYTVEVLSTSRLEMSSLSESVALTATVVQGAANRVSLEVFGPASVLKVEGKEIQGWSVRQEGDKRFVDLALKDPKARQVQATITLERGDLKTPSEIVLTTFGPASSSAFSAVYAIQNGQGVVHEPIATDGLQILKSGEQESRFSTNKSSRLVIRSMQESTQPLPVEFRDVSLIGKIDSKQGSAEFQLVGTVHVASREPISLPVLKGRAAPLSSLSTPDYRLRLREGAYEIEFKKPGVYPIHLSFVTPVVQRGEWKTIDFIVASGAVVPVLLNGVDQATVFDPALPVIPNQQDGKMMGFLPASGACQFAWQEERKTEEGKLFYTTESMGEISVDAGLIRQMTVLKAKALQGSLDALAFKLEGAGEVVSVEGDHLLSWKISEQNQLEIGLSRPVTEEATFVIRSQSAFASLPVKTEVLRMTPLGAVRHSGFFRVYNRGAVRIEVMNTSGLTQLSPDQYPEAARLPDQLRQVFYYRFPAASRTFTIAAERVKPEVNISQTLSYELTETDRILRADLELDVREAPIREWELLGPSDYSIVSVTGVDVADYVASTSDENHRRIKVIFGKEVSGRRLVQLHFEKNQSAQAGSWVLPSLSYPGSQVVRSELGVSAAPGYRVSPEAQEGLIEMPLIHFVKRGPTLQQAFRIRGETWKASMLIEALDQNVQADVFHLYSLKEEVAYVSVLVNFFVTGAPVDQWELKVPEGIEHLNVDGRDVRDSRVSEQGVITVPLHRPVMGAYQLLVTYEQKAEANLSLGELTPLHVQGERGFVQVVSPGQVELSESEKKDQPGLIKLDPLELPAEYRLMSYAPSLSAWQYNTRPKDLEVGIEWFSRGETAKQIVEFADFSSRIDQDGGVVTISTFDVRLRQGRNLDLDVPDGLLIGEVTVNGASVPVRESGEKRLVPLPDTIGPNEPVRVVIRSSSQGGGSLIKLAAPAVSETTQLMTRWKVETDAGYALLPVRSEGMDLLTVMETENGFSWIEKEALLSFCLLIASWMMGMILVRVKSGFSLLGSLVVLFAASGAFYLGAKGFEQTHKLAEVLEYSVPILGPDQLLTLAVEHLEAGDVLTSEVGIVLLVIGGILGALGLKFVASRRSFITLSAGLLSFGLLLQVRGAGVFFCFLGVIILLLWWPHAQSLPSLLRAEFHKKRNDDEQQKDRDGDQDLDSEKELKGGSMGGVTTLLVAFFVMSVSTSTSKAQDLTGDSLTESWTIRSERLESDASLLITAEAGQRFALLRSPATLMSFQGEHLRIVVEKGSYFVVATSAGTHQLNFSYQAPAVDLAKGIPVVTGAAALKSLKVSYEALGWSIDSPSAVRREVLKSDKGSTSQLWLAPDPNPVVVLTPKLRDVSSEVTQIYSEIDDLFIPGPGVVDGIHRVRIRPAQGQVKQLIFSIPSGFTVSDVESKVAGPWRFDPERGVLTVDLITSQSQPFLLQIETQKPLEELPAEVSVSPLKVVDSSGEVGMMALAFGKEAQLEQDQGSGMSLVNLADFDSSLIPQDKNKQPIASLQKVYRYSQGDASLSIKVAPVAPEIRVTSQHRLSLGDERTILASDLTATITRAGIFRLSFPLPEGFEVESLTGAALNHWAEVEEDGQTVVIMNLNGKTLGEQKFSLVLAGVTPQMPVNQWSVPKVELREAARQTGQLILVPGRGIQLRVEQRKDLSALDPRSVGGTQAGALAFRLLQKSWRLDLALDQLEPSIAAQVLTDVELRDGRSMTRVNLQVQVENASVKDLKILLPGISETDAQTIRASGGEIRDIVKNEDGSWLIRFKRRVIGNIPIRIEYEQNRETSGELVGIESCLIPEARQQESFLALRPGARLDLAVESAPGWNSTDWVALPKALIQLDRSGAPNAFLRSTRAGEKVQVKLKRHSVIASSKIRVNSGRLLTILSPQGEVMNQADLELETLQRGSMTLTLPPASYLFGVFVNEESALVVRDGDSYRFHITGDSGGRDAKLRFTYASSYSASKGDHFGLSAFKLGEPLENVTWEISIPEGYRLRSTDGDLDLSKQSEGGGMTRGKYLELVTQRNTSKQQEALGRLGKVSGYLQAGEQGKAAQTLEQVYNGFSLDAASNEDARVKLENLVTQQAVVGLNTRRQRLWLDNRGNAGVAIDPAQNDQIEDAANANPVFAGNLNFGKVDFQNVIQGNDIEVNRMLNTIATKWIRHQRVTEPVSQMLDPVISPSGDSLIFTRAIQVSGDQALALNLDLEQSQSSSSMGRQILVAGLLLLLIFGLTSFGFARK